MDKQEQEKFLDSLKKEEKTILSELAGLTIKNPKAEDHFDVPFPNEGDTLDENAREITEFERTKAVVDNLQNRLHDVRNTIQKLKEGTYAKIHSHEV